MAPKRPAAKETHLDKFKAAARELESDDSEQRLLKALKMLGTKLPPKDGGGKG